MATANRTKPGDVTGRQRAEQIAAVAEAEIDRANEITMITQQKRYDEETVVKDYTGNPSLPTTVVDEIQDVGVSLADDSVLVRIIEDLPSMTFGAGNVYDFKKNTKVKVTKAMANHLVEKGYASFYL